MVLHPQGPLWSLHKPPYPTPIKPKVFGYLKRIKRQPNAENPTQVRTCEMQVRTCMLLLLGKPRNSSRYVPAKCLYVPALEFLPKTRFSTIFNLPKLKQTPQIIPKQIIHFKYNILDVQHVPNTAHTQEKSFPQKYMKSLKRNHGDHSPWLALDLCWRGKACYWFNLLQMAFKIQEQRERERVSAGARDLGQKCYVLI